jgi:hypothetical protein
VCNALPIGRRIGYARVSDRTRHRHGASFGDVLFTLVLDCYALGGLSGSPNGNMSGRVGEWQGGSARGHCRWTSSSAVVLAVRRGSAVVRNLTMRLVFGRSVGVAADAGLRREVEVRGDRRGGATRATSEHMFTDGQPQPDSVTRYGPYRSSSCPRVGGSGRVGHADHRTLQLPQCPLLAKAATKRCRHARSRSIQSGGCRARAYPSRSARPLSAGCAAHMDLVRARLHRAILQAA